MDIVPFLIVFFIGYFVGKKICFERESSRLTEQNSWKKVKFFFHISCLFLTTYEIVSILRRFFLCFRFDISEFYVSNRHYDY